MKVKILMAALVVTLMLGVRGYANPCDAACVDPCGPSCDRFSVRGGDLFSGLKRLVNGVRIANNCNPCDAVVACNPCDVVACDPCDAVCNAPRGIGLGGRLRNLLASPSLCGPCDAAGNCFDAQCGPCDVVRDCDPCGEIDSCARPRFSLRSLNLFGGLRLNRGCFTDCDPCNGVADCGPCDSVACGPCDFVADCGPCDVVCGDNYCGPRGHLFDLPRVNLSRLFDRIRVARCNVSDCGPCDEVRPCDSACCR